MVLVYFLATTNQLHINTLEEKKFVKGNVWL